MWITRHGVLIARRKFSISAVNRDVWRREKQNPNQPKTANMEYNGSAANTDKAEIHGSE